MTVGRRVTVDFTDIMIRAQTSYQHYCRYADHISEVLRGRLLLQILPATSIRRRTSIAKIG